MQNSNEPRVVVIGTGFGGLEAVFNLRKRLGKRVSLTVIGEKETFLFKPNTIYIPFGKPPEAFEMPMRQVFEKRHIPFIHERAEQIDSHSKTVRTTTTELPYDYLVVATGASMRPAEIPGLAEHAVTIWTPEEMLRVRSAIENATSRAREAKGQEYVSLYPRTTSVPGHFTKW